MLEAEFQTKPPGKTYFLKLVFQAYEDGQPPIALEQLKSAGWVMMPLQPLWEVDKTKRTVYISKPGSGVFRSWTPEEKVENLKTATQIIKSYGIKATKRTLTAADMV